MNRPVLIIAAGVLVILVAVGANYVLWQQEVTEEPTIATTTEPRAVAEPAPGPSPVTSPPPAPTSTPDAATPEHQTPEDQTATTPATPSSAPESPTPTSPRTDTAAAGTTQQPILSAEVTASAEPTTPSPPETTTAQRTRQVRTAQTQTPSGTVAAAPETPPAGEQTASLPEPKASEPTIRRPSFDVVRVSPEGETVMAGRAEPGKKTRIVDRGKVIGEVVADTRGEWVFVPEAPLPPGNSEITLQTENDGGEAVESDSAIVMLVPEEGRDIAGQPAKAAQPLVMKVQRDDPATGKPIGARQASIVLQGPTGDLGTPTAGLSIDAVDYDPDGQLSISGRAIATATVQIYLSNRFLGRTTADDNGVWSLVPSATVEPGIYTLRADQLNAKGQVSARVEIPFSRAEPMPLGPGRFVIVQPGNSLWRIARRTYGSGFAFTTIFGANAGQIADPDLIYPGQIFQLPAPE